jgi:hypothetical protein
MAALRTALLVRPELLDLDGGAGLLEVGLQLVGLLALEALLDGAGGLVDERLGLLQAEAGRRADDLDDLDLLVAGAGEDDVERRLLAGAAAATAVAETPNSSSSALMRSESSSTEIDLSSSIHSWVLVAIGS